MPRFYLQTDEKVVAGPFTALEIREAAMANLVTPECQMAHAADGPWTPLSRLGMFSETNVALPHPTEPIEPIFRLKGVNEAFQGPFKLRDLIGFASRHILPRDAAIQVAERPDWIPVHEFGILNAYLHGPLSSEPVSSSNAKSAKKLPELRPHPSAKDSASRPSGGTPQNGPGSTTQVGVVRLADLATKPMEDIDLILNDHRIRRRDRLRDELSEKNKPAYKFKFKPIHTAWLLAPVLVLIVAWWLTRPPSSQTDATQATGNWVLIPSRETGNAFGISMKGDRSCVVVNSNGNCWMGTFQWSNDMPDESELVSLDRTGTKSSDRELARQRDAVLESDGFVRLESNSSRVPPLLGEKPISECFMRRRGDFLWIGYELSAGDGASIEAKWHQLWPRNSPTRGSNVGSVQSASELLSRFGVPDEARSLNAAEKAANGLSAGSEPISLVRYGTDNMTVYADGSVRRFKTP